MDLETDSVTAAEHLRAAKEAARLSWPQVSTLTGVPLKTLMHWSAGERTPADYVLQPVLDKIRAATGA